MYHNAWSTNLSQGLELNWRQKSLAPEKWHKGVSLEHLVKFHTATYLLYKALQSTEGYPL